MKVTLIAVGSRGDVQPYVALGAGLHKAGHSVRVLASPDFRELVTAAGLHFSDMGGSTESVARGMESMLERGNFLEILSSMGASARRMIEQAAVSGMEACLGSDVIVAGLGGFFVGLALSEKLGIRFVPAFVYPFTPTREFPSVLAPSTPVRLPGWANRLSHLLAQQMMWQTFRAAENQARRQVLRIPPAPFWGPFGVFNRGAGTILYGYSRHVIPVPADWDDSMHVTGFWPLEPPRGWKPPAGLVKFLESGDPPVYIGFGSMIHRKPEEVTGLVLSALARTGRRGVLSAGWGGIGEESLPESVYPIGSMPHEWLFPRMAAVVHHGGAGTTAAGLRAGVPAVVTPFFGDQPFWGERVHALGVGPKPIPRPRLNADNLAQAIDAAVSDSGMIKRAARLGEQIRAEDGIARAVEFLGQGG
jgi:sterol 3beta-glucosyltransferase